MSPKSMASPSGTAVSQQLIIRDRSHLELQKVTRYSHMFSLHGFFFILHSRRCQGKRSRVHFLLYQAKNKLLTCILLVRRTQYTVTKKVTLTIYILFIRSRILGFELAWRILWVCNNLLCCECI